MFSEHSRRYWEPRAEPLSRWAAQAWVSFSVKPRRRETLDQGLPAPEENRQGA